MITFTTFVSTARLSVWRWRKRLSRRRFVCVPMQAKHISRARHIFIVDTVIMMALSLSWKLLDRLCRMMPGYSSSKDTLSVAAQVVTKRRLTQS